MEYYFNQLDHVKFQRLINTILVARFGEDARLTPLRGPDGGRDGETAPGNRYFEFQVGDTISVPQSVFQPPRKGRYLFQVKHHRTTDGRLSDSRQAVIADFERELKTNVLSREGDERVNYFFLVTNVPSSKDALNKLDRIRESLVGGAPSLHADVWWQETITTYLDQMPSVWNSFPEMFAGSVVPFLAKVVNITSEGLPRAIRLAINRQYARDKNVKFRQIELEQRLSKLFVDLDIDIQNLPDETRQKLSTAEFRRYEQLGDEKSSIAQVRLERQLRWRSMGSRSLISALGVLLDDDRHTSIRKLVLEGGPGQGKSTITQMAVQIYRQQILDRHDMDPDERLLAPEKLRLPFRIELRSLAEWLSNNPNGSVEEYLALMIKQDSGGSEVSVDDIHTAVEKSPVFLIFDGLDEVGSDKLRSNVLNTIMDCIGRFETGLHTDLRVVITTRPPALAGRRENLVDFEQLVLAPMEKHRTEEYVTRWLSVQIREDEERERIRQSFERRQDEPHVEALARNPMQLSVLLQFIRLKGEAFPDRRAELYRDYFQIVIDRDVEKSPELRRNRGIIETLHAFLGYKIHALTEVNQADRALDRNRLFSMVEEWLAGQGHDPRMAQQFFKLGEERFGLIVASKGEGTETRYGYEVQPIQEYFAAAFISNQVSARSAHEVFEAMIHRPYWREVALFFAGLRRPNEKADLVARAKKVDQDQQLGWYQDGRAIVLQLLQEGVFSEPPYVFSQALDFVLDLLDVRKLEVQREPPNLLSTLGALVSRNPLGHHRSRVLQLLQDYNTCEDSYVMMRLYRVASRLLQRNDFVHAVMSYKGACPDLVASIRLGWLYRWEIDDIEKLSRSASFWQGVPDSSWAQVWWRETLSRGVALNLAAPIGVHQHLVEQFAADPTSSIFDAPLRRPPIKAVSKLAIWRLIRYQQMLQMLGVYKGLDETTSEAVRQEIESVSKDGSDIDYAGLGKSVRIVVKDLIQSSRALLKVSCDNEGEPSALANYIQKIREYLQYPGVVSWVACRCAVNIIQSSMLADRNIFAYRAKPPQLKTLQVVVGQEDLLSLAGNIRPFYEETGSDELDSSKGESRDLALFLDGLVMTHIFRRRGMQPIPRYVRLEPGVQPVALVDLLAESVSGGSNLPLEWMKTMPLSMELIRPLIEKCRDCLPDLLVLLSEYDFVHIGAEAPLRVWDTQRILKIARNTDDSKRLAGVATVLLNARFLRMAEPSLILKILRAAPESSLAFALFRIHRSQIEGREQDLLDKEATTVKKVAQGVLDRPDEYAFQTVCQAANFLAEHEQVAFPPLLHDKEKLGIEV